MKRYLNNHNYKNELYYQNPIDDTRESYILINVSKVHILKVGPIKFSVNKLPNNKFNH